MLRFETKLIWGGFSDSIICLKNFNYQIKIRDLWNPRWDNELKMKRCIWHSKDFDNIAALKSSHTHLKLPYLFFSYHFLKTYISTVFSINIWSLKHSISFTKIFDTFSILLLGFLLLQAIYLALSSRYNLQVKLH